MSFWKQNKQFDLQDEAPFIFPYFFYKDKISLTWKSDPVDILLVEDVKLKMPGHCVFRATLDDYIGALNVWTYFKQITNTDFVCYTLSTSENSLADFYIFSTDNLNVIKDFREKISEMKARNLPFLFNTDINKLEISETLSLGINKFDFPESYKQIDEISIFSTKKDLYSNVPKDEYWANYVLLILKPIQDTIELIPLDWFNRSGDDFGYVWPTRVVRNRTDKKFYGEGIRMGKFILDPSGRNKIG